MLAPLRDYLSPKDPKTSTLLRITKECYFARMSININPNMPNFRQTRWITSEDVNIEHLLDVFTTIDANSDSVWVACTHFMEHLLWHKPRLTISTPKIKGLPDDHRSKPGCLYQLSRLFVSVGNRAEQKQLLVRALTIWRERGSDRDVASALMELSGVNQAIGLHKERIQ